MLRFFSATLLFAVIAAPVFSSQVLAVEDKNKPVAQQQVQPAKKAPDAKSGEKKDEAAQKEVVETDSQKTETKPAEQPEGAKYDQDSANAPERQAECLWTGQRIVSLLLRDDVNTAREHTNFYDRFGCPKEYITVAFRCAIVQAERQPQQTDIAARVYGCWMSPELAERP